MSPEKIGHAENAVQRGTDLVRNHRQEPRLGAVGRFGLVARDRERALDQYAIGHVAADALHLACAVGAYGHFAPGDPAGAIDRRYFLIIGARPVRHDGGFALFQHRQREGAGNQVFAAAAGKRAISVVNVIDRAIGVAPHDHIVLRLEETRGALLGLANFPVPVGRLVETRFEFAQFRLHPPDARDQNAHGATGGAEQ